MASSPFIKSKVDDFFWEWLCNPESQKIVRQAIQFAKSDNSSDAPAPSPYFGAHRTTPSGRPSPVGPSPPGSPASGRPALGPAPGAGEQLPSQLPHSPPPSGLTVTPDSVPSLHSPVSQLLSPLAASPAALPVPSSPGGLGQGTLTKLDTPARAGAGSGEVIPQFWWPKRKRPVETLPEETRQQISNHFARQNITDGIRTYQQLEPIVTDAFNLSKYFVVPIFHKIKVFFELVDSNTKSKESLLGPSPVPITEQMIVSWCSGKIQPEDLVLSFFYVVKKEHNDFIERDDFSIFLMAILLTHPGLDFLRETQEFQDRYADTVISRIFFVYDRKDVGRIPLSSLRRYKPSVIEVWKQLAEHDDIKMIRDYFSYEHFYVVYCTFWELDSDHNFLLDKDDLLKYDGHALSRRTVDRIFSESPVQFTSTVPGKMGYEDFTRFLLCDQDRLTDRSMEYWFNMFDLDGDGCIRDHEMKYFYEEQVQRMECLNYDTIPFADILCQMNDMISPKSEGVFRLADFKRRRKFAGTFFSLFSSLNKFLAFEHRDPFLAKQEQLDNPTFSDWDRWCADEYLRLAMEEGDDEGEDDGK